MYSVHYTIQRFLDLLVTCIVAQVLSKSSVPASASGPAAAAVAVAAAPAAQAERERASAGGAGGWRAGKRARPGHVEPHHVEQRPCAELLCRRRSRRRRRRGRGRREAVAGGHADSARGADAEQRADDARARAPLLAARVRRATPRLASPLTFTFRHSLFASHFST